MNMQSCIKNILGGMSMAFLLAVSACSDDSQATFENEILPEGVPASVYDNFRQSFPEATDASWTVSDGYAIVTFSMAETRSKAGKATVWYELKDGRKKMHCRTIGFDALPEAVRNAFADSEYAAWNTEEEACLLTRYADGTVETIYVVRARNNEGNEAREATLYYTAEGLLVKLTVEVIYDENYRNLDADYSEWLPQTPPDAVAAFISSNYPQAQYLHIHVGKEFTKVKILDRWQARMLLFDAEGNWISTETQLHVNELPEAVLSAFHASAYAAFRIDDAKECQTAADGHYYLLTIKDFSGKKQEIRIFEDGTLEGEGNENTPSAPEEGDDHKGEGNKGEGDGNEGNGEGNGNEPGDNGTFLSKTEINDFIAQRYPGASITDRDYDEKGVEIELSYNGAKIKVRFELHPQGYLWMDSEWDLDLHQSSAIPTAIQETIARSYSDFLLYFLKYTETAQGEEYYMAGLKSASLRKDIKVKMDVQGNVLAEYGKR